MKNFPFELTLILTRHCNLNCVYCYERYKDNSVMPFDVATRSIEKCLNEGNYDEVTVSLFGGEPFLEFDLMRSICEWTWSRSWSKKITFFVNTNGTLLTEEIKKWTSENRHRMLLGLSLDGSKETHDANRSGSFDAIDLDFFLANWPQQAVKMTIAAGQNLSRLADDIIFIHEKGFKLEGCNIAEGIEIADFDKNMGIISEQLHRLIDYYLEHPNVEIAPLLQMPPLSYCENPDLTRKKRCGTGENMRVIDVDGKAYPCTFFSPLTLNAEQLTEIQSLNLNDDDLLTDSNCMKNCYLFPICHGCYGDNYATTGKLAQRSAQRCALIKLRALACANYTARKIAQDVKQTHISQQEKATIKAIETINNLFAN